MMLPIIAQEIYRGMYLFITWPHSFASPATWDIFSIVRTDLSGTPQVSQELTRCDWD